ncbi:MAG TPA: HEAT repeat domain-containing protein [Pyrinomonadaceae bacterium]|nr:HEAT repeat domain-containing protein [Pyrinomonadaceae bacterium]
MSTHRTARITLFKLIFLVFAVAPFAAQAQTTPSQSFTTSEGDLFEVSLELDKDTIMLSEPMYMSFHFKSFSSRDLCVGIGGDYRNKLGRPNSFKVSVVREDAKAVPQPDAGPGFGGFSGCGIIPAGKTYDIRLYLPHWATFEDAGSYEITVERNLRVGAYTAESVPTSFKARLSRTLNVVANDSEQTSALINSLGAVMLEKDNQKNREAASMLGYYVKDKRTLPHFAAAMEKFGAEPEWSDEQIIVAKAAWALSTFDDDRAIDALEKVMTSQVDDTRLAVAEAFAASKHARAYNLLLSMKNDTYSLVRVRIAERLSQVNSKDSIALLREMLADENEDVRKAARVSLDKLRKNDANGMNP